MDTSEIERLCLAVLDRFMAALNAHDAAAMDATMHFPHVRHAEEKLKIYDATGSNPMDLFDRLREEDDWLRSAWTECRLVQCSSVKAHWAVSYVRYRSDGSEIGHYDSLYTLTKVNGAWGIQMRSSFGP